MKLNRKERRTHKIGAESGETAEPLLVYGVPAAEKTENGSAFQPDRTGWGIPGFLGAAAILFGAAMGGCEAHGAEKTDAGAEKVQTIRFVEDDAQNEMVSKIYELKHQKANDLVPFLTGAVKRYAKNSSADRINYSAGKKQLVAVTCPAPMMRYVDDLVAKLDRPGAKGPDGSGIDGTGIVRGIYTPVWRSGESLVNLMVKSGITSNASEGANQDAAAAFDAATNRIYWKDSLNKDKDLKKYLEWLDRPVPQAVVTVNVYEVRESDLLDLGLDYMAWKNGPGLNLFDAGANFLEGSAVEKAFGPYGFFLFAPSFDLSFVRVLRQNGKARIAASASVTVTTGNDGKISFTPDYQNIVKDNKFATSVVSGGGDTFELTVSAPVISFDGETDAKTGLPAAPAKNGIVTFGYTLNVKHAVERDNHGSELYDETRTSGDASFRTGEERMLTRWTNILESEQTIGVPFLCELPVLKYIFGTTTKTRENVYVFVAAEAQLTRPDEKTGKFAGIPAVTENNEVKK